ncbi:ComEA family DNA-binding protein [Emticicia sp. C21]|uniref:ComEA family DNA-binding protein n=1 Tax=Emticicia sp. C21 TaxID=2302915 RepID=UPI000E3501D7|nr:helix-hairpin-helix domain-containing protein [Emticicia sp. C21]RFS14007.1 helix-hairpin-helix domain-containing protein [Emticicia sp. C21]
MNRLLKFIRTSLSMTSHEAKGVVMAFGISIGVILLMWGADYFFSQKPQNLVISSPKMLDSLTVAVDNQTKEYNTNRQFKSDYTDNKTKTYKHFNFDPNTATVAQLEELGLPKFIAERIEKYRNKGGKFRKKEDLAKIYGLYPETYERLEPYITLPSAEEASTNTPQAEIIAQPVVAEKPVTVAPKKAEALAKFDLNTTDTTQLKLIRGIGSGYAKRIVKFRDILGGFAIADQVRETYGLPTETADELLKYGYVNGNIKKLKVNQLSLADLRHPYLRFAQARAIIAYREQHGSFKSIEDLKRIKLLDDATIQKIEPYLEF